MTVSSIKIKKKKLTFDETLLIFNSLQKPLYFCKFYEAIV